MLYQNNDIMSDARELTGNVWWLYNTNDPWNLAGGLLQMKKKIPKKKKSRPMVETKKREFGNDFFS